MFEDSTPHQGKRRPSAWPLAVSAVLHAGVIAALAVAAARAPARGAGERPIDVIFLRAATGDAAGAPAAPATPAERRAARERQAMLDRLVQPAAIPDAAADGAAAPSAGTPGAGDAGAAPAGDADLPVEAGGGIVSPRVIDSSRVAPVYPEEAQRDGIEGLVVLEVVVDERGSIGDITVLRGLGHGCDEAAIAAVRQWKLHPATRNGKPIKVRHVIPFDFRL